MDVAEFQVHVQDFRFPARATDLPEVDSDNLSYSPCLLRLKFKNVNSYTVSFKVLHTRLITTLDIEPRSNPSLQDFRYPFIQSRPTRLSLPLYPVTTYKTVHTPLSNHGLQDCPYPYIQSRPKRLSIPLHPITTYKTVHTPLSNHDLQDCPYPFIQSRPTRLSIPFYPITAYKTAHTLLSDHSLQDCPYPFIQ